MAIGRELSKVQEDRSIKIDGKLDEPFWNLDQLIAEEGEGDAGEKGILRSRLDGGLPPLRSPARLV